MRAIAAFLAGVLAVMGPAAAQSVPATPDTVPDAAAAERLVTGLSHDAVAITTSFTGSEILIYGAIRREAQAGDTQTRDASPPDIIVTLEGPSQSVTVRRKERVAGIWINTAALRIASAPDFYVVASTGPLDRILNPDEDVRHRISPAFAVRALSEGAETENATPFTEALLRLRGEQGRYRLDEGSVAIVDDTLFRADVRMPSNLVEGDYRVRMFLVRDGRVIDSNTAPIRVEKVGLERWLYRLAMHQPFWYGLMSLAIAMGAGGLASAAFRAIRRRG